MVRTLNRNEQFLTFLLIDDHYHIHYNWVDESLCFGSIAIWHTFIRKRAVMKAIYCRYCFRTKHGNNIYRQIGYKHNTMGNNVSATNRKKTKFSSCIDGNRVKMMQIRAIQPSIIPKRRRMTTSYVVILGTSSKWLFN